MNIQVLKISIDIYHKTKDFYSTLHMYEPHLHIPKKLVQFGLITILGLSLIGTAACTDSQSVQSTYNEPAPVVETVPEQETIENIVTNQIFDDDTGDSIIGTVPYLPIGDFGTECYCPRDLRDLYNDWGGLCRDKALVKSDGNVEFVKGRSMQATKYYNNLRGCSPPEEFLVSYVFQHVYDPSGKDITTVCLVREDQHWAPGNHGPDKRGGFRQMNEKCFEKFPERYPEFKAYPNPDRSENYNDITLFEMSLLAKEASQIPLLAYENNLIQNGAKILEGDQINQYLQQNPELIGGLAFEIVNKFITPQGLPALQLGRFFENFSTLSAATQTGGLNFIIVPKGLLIPENFLPSSQDCIPPNIDEDKCKT